MKPITTSVLLGVLLVSVYGMTDQCSGPDVSLRINPDADVRFTVILTLREPTVDNRCGPVWSDEALQTVGVIQWAVERINNHTSFIHGVKIGFDVYDDCGVERYSISRAIGVVDGLPLGSDACANGQDTVCQIGIVGTSKSATTEAVLESISGTNVPVLSPFSTYPDLSRFSNFYRTTLSQDQQLTAILEYLVEVNWNYIAVVHTDDLFGRYGSQALKDLGQQRGICVDVTYEISNLDDDALVELFTKLQGQKRQTKDGSLGVVFLGGKDTAGHLLTQLNFRTDEAMKHIYWILPDSVGNDIKIFHGLDNGAGNNTVVFSKFSTDLPSVKRYVNSKWERAINKSSNPGDDIDSVFICAGRTEIPEWTNQNAESVLDAVYVLASAVQRQQKFHCSGNPGICPELKKKFKLDSDLVTSPLDYSDMPGSVTVPEFATAQREVRFTVDGDVQPSNTEPLYNLYMYTRYENKSYSLAQVAEIRNHTVNTAEHIGETNLNEIIATSECGANCPACVNDSDLRYMYIDGDSLILGLFSLHETNPDDPFRCGEVRFNGSDIFVVEAFTYRLEELNRDTGARFGAIIFDACYSSAQTELIITQFLSGKLILKKPNSSDNIDVSKILAAVGSLGSDVTIPLSFLFTKLKIPFISSTSSSPDLDDRINFPYFLRTVPSDVEQARAMVKIMKFMGWEYASALYVSNNYGSKGKEQFLWFANQSNICVAESPEAIPEVDADPIDLQQTFTRLKNQNAKVVMYFGTEARITEFLRVIDNRNDFIFLASEDWGNQEYILDEGKLGTLGSVVLKNEGVRLTSDGSYVEYIKKLNPYNNIKNPWFTEYWEHLYNCDLPLSFQNKYATSCDQSLTFSDDYIQDILTNQRVIHIIDAVDALWAGLQNSRTELCEFDDSFPCPNYFKYISNVVANIKGVSLRRGSNDVRIFKDDGNGNVGFEILNVQQDQNQHLVYVPVGTFNDQGLQLTRSSIRLRRANFDALCTPSLCDHCTNTSKKGGASQEIITHVHPADNTFTAPHFTIVGLLAFLIVLMVILMLLVVCYFKRRVAALQKQLTEICNNLTHTKLSPPTQRYPYVNQNGTAGNGVQGNSRSDYSALNIMKLGPSGETLQDWRDAQLLLNGSNTNRNVLNGGNATRNGIDRVIGVNANNNVVGHVNRAFVGDDLMLQSPSGEGNASNSSAHSTQRTKNTPLQDSPSYKPSKSAYGLSTHNSFKRLDHNSQQTSPLKKQPRTQLAVPPCRPELPPRNEHVHRPDNLDLALPTAVPKDKPRKHRSPPRKSSMSPRELKYTQSFDSTPRNINGEIGSPRINGTMQQMAFSAGTIQNEENQTSPSGRINVHGSMEKISRV